MVRPAPAVLWSSPTVRAAPTAAAAGSPIGGDTPPALVRTAMGEPRHPAPPPANGGRFGGRRPRTRILVAAGIAILAAAAGAGIAATMGGGGEAAATTRTTASTSTGTVHTVTPIPETTIYSGPSGRTDDATPTFTFSSIDAEASFQCRVDAGAFARCTSPHTTTALARGPHTFKVRAKHRKPDPTPASRSFRVVSRPTHTTTTTTTTTTSSTTPTTTTTTTDRRRTTTTTTTTDRRRGARCPSRRRC